MIEKMINCVNKYFRWLTVADWRRALILKHSLSNESAVQNGLTMFSGVLVLTTYKEACLFFLGNNSKG